jgi:hypothetical protein
MPDLRLENGGIKTLERPWHSACRGLWAVDIFQVGQIDGVKWLMQPENGQSIGAQLPSLLSHTLRFGSPKPKPRDNLAQQ